MKRFDFTKKHNICAVCFVIVMLLTSILCFTLPVVHADESLTLSDFYYIDEFLDKSTASSLNGTSGYYDVPSGIFASDSQLIYDNPMEYYEAIKSIFNDPDVITLFDSTYSFWRQSGTTNAISEITFCHNIDGTLSLMLEGIVSVDYDNMQNYKFRNPSSYQGSSIYRFDWNGSKLVFNRVYYGGSYTNCQDIDGYIASTSPMYMYYPSYNQNLNYVLIDGKIGKGSGGISGIEAPYPDESADNNMFMKDTDFIFTHQTYYAPYSSSLNTGSYYPIGTVSFKGQPNDYQIQHPEEFSLAFDFSFLYDVDYKNQSGTEYGYFKKTSPTWDNSKNLKLSFATGSALVTPYYVPLSTFIQNKNSCDFVIKDIFDSMTDSMGTSLTGVLAQSNEITSLSYNNFKLYCNVCLVHNGDKSGHYEEWYNFNSKKGYTTDKTMNENPNPYVPNPKEQADDDPDSTNIQPKPNVPGPGGSDDDSPNSTTTTSNGNGSIVINNNPTFNNNPSASANATSNGNGGGMIPTFLSYLSNGQQASVETIQSVANTNGWLNVVKDVYSFVPVTLWISLIHYFTIAVTILIVGFILSIVIKFIT